MTRRILSVLFATVVFARVASPCEPGMFHAAITDTGKTSIRKGFGEYGSPRGSGSHSGIDIVPNQSFSERSAYSVGAIGPGVVAYSRLNGAEDSGYGNLLVIDHGNDCYSLYAHLASDPFKPLEPGGNLLKSIGDAVGAGETIGYFVNIQADVDSTGNARTTSPEARHQVHFEIISAPSGRSGQGTLAGTILKDDGRRVDPTETLIGLRYRYTEE